jgi:hypothetical protein
MIAADLPFESSTATRLMAIARHPWISNPAHAQLLPDSWPTAYELTKLPNDALEKAKENGDINPRMSRREATALVREAVPPKPKRKKPEQEEPGSNDNAAEADADMVRQWANSFSVHAKDNIGLMQEWTRRFGKVWKKCPKTQDMRRTAQKVADEWDTILKVIDSSLADPNAEKEGKPKSGAERMRAWRQRQKETEGEMADGAQIDLEECIANAKAAEGDKTEKIASAADVTTTPKSEPPVFDTAAEAEAYAAKTGKPANQRLVLWQPPTQWNPQAGRSEPIKPAAEQT